jgi:hypothetical protein
MRTPPFSSSRTPVRRPCRDMAATRGRTFVNRRRMLDADLQVRGVGGRAAGRLLGFGADARSRVARQGRPRRAGQELHPSERDFFNLRLRTDRAGGPAVARSPAATGAASPTRCGLVRRQHRLVVTSRTTLVVIAVLTCCSACDSLDGRAASPQF